jgi:hypothetical protein
MNTSKRIPCSDASGLSAIEQTFPCLARHHRGERLGLLQRLKSFVFRESRLSLAITASVAGLLLTGSSSAQAAVSAPAFFNEANAAQREGQLGAAILNYERARILAPHDLAIEQNLRIAREKAGVSAPAISGWERPAHYLGFDGLALLGSSALLISCALLFGRRHVPSLSRRTVRSIAVMCSAVILLTAFSMALRWSELDRAVIQNAQTTAHIAPAANAQSTFELKAGDLVTTKREHGDFFLVRTLDQRSGWVKKTDLARVIPANPSPM